MSTKSFSKRSPIAWWVPVVLATVLAPSAWAAVTGTARASVDSAGSQGRADSYGASVSGDGRFVAFDTRSALVAADGNRSSDVYLRSIGDEKTARVSVRSGGGQANGGSFDAALSFDGRFVGFDSDATNLVRHDGNGVTDVFVRDRIRSVTRRASVAIGGRQANDDSYAPAISADGRYVAFSSYATNLVGYDTNRRGDIFVRDRSAGRTRRVSISSTGHQANGASYDAAISADGWSVAFDSLATNLVWRRDTNGVSDIFVRQRRARRTVRVSVSFRGTQANGASMNPSISADGRLVAFASYATNLVSGDTNHAADVFVRDLSTGRTTRVSVAPSGRQADGGSFDPVISADGRSVAFQSTATNLVSGDTNAAPDVFVRDLGTGVTVRESVSSTGAEANAGSFRPAVSSDGAEVAFESDASDLVLGDTNGARDVFARGSGF